MFRPIHFPRLRAVTAVAFTGLSAPALAAQAPPAADPGGAAPVQVLQGPAAEFVAGSAAELGEPAPGAVLLRLAAAADTQRIRVCKDLTLCDDTLTARVPRVVVTFPRLTFEWPHPPPPVPPVPRGRAFPWWIIPVVGGGIAIGGHHGHEEPAEEPPETPPSPEAVPEPGTLILAASGLAALAAAAARRRRARS